VAVNPLQDVTSLKTVTAQDALLARQSGGFQDVLRKVQNQAQNEEDDQKLREACQEMEAIFVQQLLRGMWATVPKSGLIEESLAHSIYKDMLIEEYSKIIAKSPQNFGLGDMLYKQLKRDMAIQESQDK